MSVSLVQTFLGNSQALRFLSPARALSAYFIGPRVLHSPARKLSSSTIKFSDSPVLDSLSSIPSPPLAPVHEQLLNALGEPSLSSLGLCSYWPSGWYQAALEALHVSFELPWWASIIATTVIIRLSLSPLVISQRRKLLQYTAAVPEFSALQRQMTNARLCGNYPEMFAISKKLKEHTMNSVNPVALISPVLIQLPVALSVFTGLRGMSALPVESMQTGGLAWFPDLTIPDPYYLLPLISMLATYAALEVGTENKHSLHPFVKLFLRFLPCVGFFVVMNIPSSILFHWTVSNFISLIQAYLFRIPAVRSRLKFPAVSLSEVVKTSSPPSGGLKEAFTNLRLLNEIEMRDRLDAKVWRQAGRSVPRTFARNPQDLSAAHNTGTSTGSHTAQSVKKRISTSG